MRPSAVHRHIQEPVEPSELKTSLEKHWAAWHPDPVFDDDYLWRDWTSVDKQVRNIVLLALDKLYDELTAQDTITGETVTFSMFPSTIEWHPSDGLGTAFQDLVRMPLRSKNFAERPGSRRNATGSRRPRNRTVSGS